MPLPFPFHYESDASVQERLNVMSWGHPFAEAEQGTSQSPSLQLGARALDGTFPLCLQHYLVKKTSNI